MGFVTKEKFLSKDFFITYAWLLGGCFVFALGAVMFAEPYGFTLVGNLLFGRYVRGKNHYLYVRYSGIYASHPLFIRL